MVNGLSPIPVAVHNQPVPLFGEPELPGQVVRRQNKLPDQGGGLGRQIRHPLDVDFWNQDQMGGGLGVDIVKSQEIVLFADDPRGDLLLGDFTEDAVAHWNDYTRNLKGFKFSPARLKEARF